jgi:pyruvate kinase
MSKTSIVATIGPVTNSLDAIKALHLAGMTVARLNGSHSDLSWHRETIKLIRHAAPSIPILLDIPGRKIRTTQLSFEPSFKAGDVVILTTDTTHDGSQKVPVNFDQLHLVLKPGVVIYADDGTLSFTVLEINGKDIHCEAKGDGTLKSKKGINVPELSLGRDLITERDREMIRFAKENNVDFVGISFVESSQHVTLIRQLIENESPKIVAKIENQGGLDFMSEVISAADVIMIDRGDLSVETSIDQVSLFQKKIIDTATILRKPVIVATELLHSMIENPFPTKAEVGDITNAVIDGAAAVMLSGETAVGKYPIEAVARLRSITAFAEKHVEAIQSRFSSSNGGIGDSNSGGEFGEAVRLLSQALPLSKIVVISRTGFAARVVAMQRLRQPIIAVSENEVLSRSFNLLPGTHGVYIPEQSEKISTEPILRALHWLWKNGELNDSDVILGVGANNGDDRHYLNLLQTYSLETVIASHGWRESLVA